MNRRGHEGALAKADDEDFDAGEYSLKHRHVAAQFVGGDGDIGVPAVFYEVDHAVLRN